MAPFAHTDDVGTASGRALVATDPRAVALSVLRPWWDQRARRAGLEGAWTDLDHALDAVPPLRIPAYVSGAALPYDGHALGLGYLETLDATERSEHGRHYTPARLADRLWAMARSGLGMGVDDQRLHGLVRDPAVGGGSLLVPALREHLRASSSVDPSFVLASLPQFLEGIDTDPWAVYLANVVLAAEMLPTLARVQENHRRPLPALARVGNSLTEDLTPALAWVMNPPYGRQKLTPHLREKFSDSLFGHANLYGLFMAAAVEGVAEEGVVAALVPTSFASGLYFNRLRSQLSERAPLRAMTFVQERDGVFGGVLQETCLALFSPKRSRRVTISRLTPDALEQVAVVPSPRTSLPWLLPRESVDAALAAVAASLPLTLRAAGWHASTGPLVWNRRRADLYPRRTAGRAHVLWAADIDGGNLHRDRSRDALRYLSLRDEADVRVNALSTPAVLVQRTTSPEQARRLVSVNLTQADLDERGGRVVVENHLNVLRPTVERPLLSHLTLARVLRTRTFDRLMRCISGSVAISSYELGALPLPAIEILAKWEGLEGEALEVAVASAYRLT